MKPHETVLVVEDEPRYQRLLCANLESRGYKTVSTQTGNAALDVVAEKEPDLMVLDIGLPDMDGFEVIRQVREFSDIPIVIVTARHEEADIVKGLEAGADDYLTKPFGISELIARVRAAIRRAASSEQPLTMAPFEADGLRIDYSAAEVSVDGRPVKLTALEYRLIRYLSHNVGKVVTPDQILDQVWGPEYVGDEHLVRVYISRLRKKIEKGEGEFRFILTRTGIGYMMVRP